MVHFNEATTTLGRKHGTRSFDGIILPVFEDPPMRCQSGRATEIIQIFDIGRLWKEVQGVRD
jgi:hypothetical protein